MKASERALQWDASRQAGRRIAAPLDIELNRRQLLALVGAGAAGLTLAAGPLAPASSSGGSAGFAATALSLSVLTAGHFLSLIGETFSAESLDGPEAGARGRLMLVDVTVPDTADRPSYLRAEPFSLVFSLEDGALGTSGIARLRQDTLGEIDLFVQRVLTGEPARYEAVFN